MSVKPHIVTGAAPGAETAERAVADMSAVVCTRDRTAQLERALGSLFEQELAPAEILVVDNAPADDSTRVLVERRFPDVRYVQEPVPGLDFARNRGLRESTQNIVAFLDDDAVADRNWSRTILRVFRENTQVGACTGRVEALALETEAQRLFEANGGFSRGNVRIFLPGDAKRPLHGHRAPLIAWTVSVGSGCSLALRREVALEIGGFDEALDLGPSLPGGGDLDILWRILQAGYHVVYEPEALAWHEHRRELEEVFNQVAGHQRALVAFVCKAAARARGVERLPVMTFLVWRLLKPGVRLLRRATGRDPLPARAIFQMWWQTCRGLAAYPAARRVAHRRVNLTAGRHDCRL